ncbi:MAG TPA: substrate-binding domain-containing protein [Burkholderiaceae bacterium]
MTLHILSAGAAKGLIGGLAPQFERAEGHGVQGPFGAVGAMKAKYAAGEPCDVIVLTAAMIAALGEAGELVEGSAADIGTVRTGVAVPAGSELPDVATALGLRNALVRASAVYFPDPQHATAGIHAMRVLGSLGIGEPLEPRLRTYPNGATAMAAMAESGGPGAIGITQVTEILYTPGVQLVGVLPPEFELATVYSMAVTRRAADPALAARFVALVTGAGARALRRDGGFE